ncbi:proton-coupled zinc antiporter SLC30A2-like [Gordionus sp. m RMFG-2023]|uniref:proton-coupled zinc antiporter SLC30A2-like n=1 Tax=Gordionus sp. m RMFG-2023 TaxID=3053472 RepID=UPI0031FC29A1
MKVKDASNTLTPTHCHEGSLSDTTKQKKSRNKLILACIICLVFTLVEVTGGYFADSLAILTDAAHLLTDFGSFVISLFSLYMSCRPPSKRLNFGWHRAEVLGAFASILLIWVLTAVLMYFAVKRVINNNYDINASVMLITATFGVVVNIIMGLVLHPHGHHNHSHANHHNNNSDQDHLICNDNLDSPSPGDRQNGSKDDFDNTEIRDLAHSSEPTSTCSNSNNTFLTPLLSPAARTLIPDVTIAQKRRYDSASLAIRAAYIHVIGDLVQSFGILIAAFVIYYRPDLKIADPICTFIFSFLVILTTLSILKDIVMILMEATPSDIKYAHVKQSLLTIPGLTSIHDLKIWCLTSEKKIAIFHAVTELPLSNNSDIQKCATQMLKEKFEIDIVNIQIEEFREEMRNCQFCNDPI